MTITKQEKEKKIKGRKNKKEGDEPDGWPGSLPHCALVMVTDAVVITFDAVVVIFIVVVVFDDVRGF